MTESVVIIKWKEERNIEMEKIRILMIDDNVNLTEMVKEYFKNNKKIEVSMCCYNGEDGLNTIIDKKDEYD